jgi:TIR domain/SIR2-like domain
VADAAGGDGRAATEALSVLLDSYSAPVPPALVELASIDKFRLIFTTDYISLVEQAFRERDKPCETLGFALRRQADPIHAHPEGDERYVYHLLGHLERFGAIALPRARQLEYLYHLTTGRNNLLGVLGDSANLLFLGCNFPEWIAGLFTRMLLDKPLYEFRDSLEVVACSELHAGRAASFTAFLRDHRVEIYPGDAAAFVSELVCRYRTKFPGDNAASNGDDGGPGDPLGGDPFVDEETGLEGQWTTGIHARPPRKGHVFISYCNVDARAVKQLSQELTRAGVSVWFDGRDVTPGIPVNDAIPLAIDNSAAFVAVVSKKALQTERSYFLREWNLALDVQHSVAPGVPFVFPVVVDDMSVSEAVARLREFFPPWAATNIAPCLNGHVAEPLVVALKEARKRFERRRVNDHRRH